jgi:nitrogen regulatory protein P-II 1
MKKIEAIIRESKLDDVVKSLRTHGVEGMTITVGPVDFVPRMKVETVVNENQADDPVEAIFQSAYAGVVGDGRIFVTEVGRVVRICTGESVEV